MMKTNEKNLREMHDEFFGCIKDVVEKFVENDGLVIDDHTDKEVRLSALVNFENYKGLGCVYSNTSYNSINLVYLDKKDDKLHVSKMSIGGVIWGSKGLQKAVTEYNDCDCDLFNPISSIYHPDGKVEYI